ncbi:putative uncharacterized protein DDB_G0282499 [Gordionus sp. m RMFG-2023]|uniref:putative uncharacterized protein DDB_G0282499 n=1 Tax=Gordionus sp. m RMFG-2023 TaxID=3053472 RepID=UPI0031FE3BF9
MNYDNNNFRYYDNSSNLRNSNNYNNSNLETITITTIINLIANQITVETTNGVIITIGNRFNTMIKIAIFTDPIITTQITMEKTTGGMITTRNQIQYDDQIQYNNNNCNMNIEEIIADKVDTAKDNNENDFNINNLTENMLNDNVFMTTLKLNDVTTTMEVDTGSKFTILSHEMAMKNGIKEIKKSKQQLTAYDGNLIKIEGINSSKNCESKLTNKIINKANDKLHLRRDAQPKIIPPRRIPYAKSDLVGKELNRWI